MRHQNLISAVSLVLIAAGCRTEPLVLNEMADMGSTPDLLVLPDLTPTPDLMPVVPKCDEPTVEPVGNQEGGTILPGDPGIYALKYLIRPSTDPNCAIEVQKFVGETTGTANANGSQVAIVTPNSTLIAVAPVRSNNFESFDRLRVAVPTELIIKLDTLPDPDRVPNTTTGVNLVGLEYQFLSSGIRGMVTVGLPLEGGLFTYYAAPKCTTQVFDYTGTDPILLANGQGYMLALNPKAHMVQLDSEGGITEAYYFPTPLNDCPFQGQSCLGPFAFRSGAVEPNGFILSVRTDYLADLAVKVYGMGIERLARPNTGYSFGFGGGVFTDDGAFAITSAGPVPYASLYKRSANGYDQVPNFIYGVNETFAGNFHEVLSNAHIGNLVGFGTTGRNGIQIVLADTDTNTYNIVQLPNDPIYPVRRVRRVFAANNQFYAYWQWAHAPNDFASSLFEVSVVNPNGTYGVGFGLTQVDIARVANGFMGVGYDPQKKEITFNAHDEQNTNVWNTKATVSLSGLSFSWDPTPVELPVIACMDEDHCAVVYEPAGGNRSVLVVMSCRP